MNSLDLILWVVAILIGIAATWYFARYYFLKSPSKKDLTELKEVDEKSSKSTQELIQKKSNEIKNENVLTANVQLENLINSQFNRYLETKKLDKDLLIRELEGNKIKTLYIVKQQEEAVEERKLLTDRIKLLGFKRVTYGDWILPPKKLKDKSFLNKKDGVKWWVQNNILQGMKEHDFVNSVVIVDLSNIYDDQRGNPKKAKKIIGGILKPADVISKDKLLSDIHKKEDVSLKEIIQLPFFDALINQDHPKILEDVKNNNSKIVESISSKLNIENLLITNLEKITQKELEYILKASGVQSYKIAADQIYKNSKILINYFNKELKLAKNLKNSLDQTSKNPEAQQVKEEVKKC